MRHEIYKKSFEKYNAVKYKDQNNILPTKVIDQDFSFGVENLYGASEKHPLFQMEKNFEGEEHFVEYFANPLYSVMKQYAMIVVEKTGDKVALKFFQGLKHRREGKTWFKTVKHVDYLSVNTKTGDVYYGYIRNYQKVRKCTKMIRRNSFFQDPLGTLKSSIKNHLTVYTDRAYDEVMMAFSEFMYEIDQRKNFQSFTFSQRLFRFYLDKRNIKYPNNFGVYSQELFGPEIKKILKKNDNRLVDSVMKKHGIFGKKVKDALHKSNRLNIPLYLSAKNMFGDDWLNQDKETIILELLNNPVSAFSTPQGFHDLVSKEELKRVYSLFKQAYIHQNLDVYTFQDHMRMYVELREYGENDLKWMSSTDKQEFRKEHLNWTDKLQHYKRGTYTRHYPEYMLEKISEPFDDYYPVLLNNSSNYNEESTIQSNCVKGYIGKAGSIIVSLRKGNVDSEVRATLEYRLMKKDDDKIVVERVQSLGKYNEKLSEEWTPILLKLDNQVLSCIRDKRFELVKITKKCNNGVILESDSNWNDVGNLRWTTQIEGRGNGYFIYDLEF